MKEITLSNSCLVTWVDDEDCESVTQKNWYLDQDGYPRFNEGNTTWCLSEFILGKEKGTEVDHKDGNRLNNRKQNLRRCTHSQNMANVGPFQNNTSGYKGVTWHKRDQKWQAQIRYQGKRVYLGQFDKLEDAALAYNKAALEYFGEFAYQNQVSL